MEEPRRFTRGRLSRGKGLRKTTGCWTCRRRRVKCDEEKPRCGGCVRKKAHCDYAPAARDGSRKTRQQQKQQPDTNEPDNSSQVPRNENDANNANDDDESDDGDNGNNNEDSIFNATEVLTSIFDQPHLNHLDETIPTADISMRPSNSIQNDPLIAGPAEDDVQVNHTMDTDQGGITGQSIDCYNEKSPETIFVSQEYSGMGSFIGFSAVYNATSSSQVQLNPTPLPCTGTPDLGLGSGAESLTSRWLDLLISDATLNYGPLPEFQFDPNGPDIFGNSVVHTPEPLNKISNHTEQPATRGTQIARPVLSSNLYLLERIFYIGEQLREKEHAWQALEPISLQPNEHILFRHFTEHISQWMDLFEPQKPFGALVPHLALRNVGLMNAILALSARHLCIVNRDSSTSTSAFRPDPNDALSYYYKALHYSQKAMQYDTYQTSLELLASAIIISSYEMLDGSSTNWEKHLKGVFWIQRSQVIHGDSNGLRQAVWWAWLCQDVWAAFREKRKPFTFWKPARLLVNLSPYELAARAVYNFAHVIGFCALEDASANTKDEVAKNQEANRLLQQLEQWRLHLTVEFCPLPMSDVDCVPFPRVWIQPVAFGVSMQLYYCSLILLHLHRPWRGGLVEYLDRQRALRRWARIVCGIAKTCTDYASSIMSSQCVFIAGMVIEDSVQRREVLELLDACSQQAGWPGFSLGRELEEVWRID